MKNNKTNETTKDIEKILSEVNTLNEEELQVLKIDESEEIEVITAKPTKLLKKKISIDLDNNQDTIEINPKKTSKTNKNKTKKILKESIIH